MYCDVNSPTSSVLHISKFPFLGYCSLPRFFVRYGERDAKHSRGFFDRRWRARERTKAMTQVNIISCFAWFIDDWAQRWSLHNSVASPSCEIWVPLQSGRFNKDPSIFNIHFLSDKWHSFPKNIYFWLKKTPWLYPEKLAWKKSIPIGQPKKCVSSVVVWQIITDQ